MDIFGHLDEILRNKVPISILFQYYSSFTPLIFVQTVPIASLLSIVYMLSILNKNNELTAAKACGISINQLLFPVFAIAAILSLISFLVNENAVPKGIITAKRIKAEYMEKTYGTHDKLKIIKNLTVYGRKNQLIYAQEFNPAKNRLTGIIIIEHDSRHRLQKKILASKAIWKNGKWLFYDCIVYKFDVLGKTIGNPLVFKEKILKFPETPEDLLKYELQTGYMSYKSLKNYIDRLSGQNPKMLNSLKTELYFKGALPFVSIIIMLIGIPFALTTSRGGAMAGIGISITIGLLYYGSIYFVLAMGKGGLLPPIVAAHISNMLFFIIALILIKRSPQ
jgi:lipopolysaccharide export system permease protein